MSKPVLVLSLASFVVFLGGCPTVDLGEAPAAPAACRPDPSYYRDVIWPEYIAPGSAPARSCVNESGCHDQANSPRSSFQVQVPDEPVPMIVHDQNYRVVTRFLNCGSPEVSTMLTRPLESVDTHGGGDLFAPGSMPEQVFLDWFNAGAP